MSKNLKKCEVLVFDKFNKTMKKCGAHAVTQCNVKAGKRLLDSCNGHKTVFCQAKLSITDPRTSRRHQKLCPFLAVEEYGKTYYCTKHLEECKNQDKFNEEVIPNTPNNTPNNVAEMPKKLPDAELKV